MALLGPPDIEKLKAKGNVNGLIKALGYEKDSSVQKAASEALGEIGDDRAVEPLIEALEKGRFEVQIAAKEALEMIGVPDDPETQVKYAIASKGWSKTIPFGEIAVEPLIAAFKENSDAAWPLARIGDLRAIEALLYSLKSKNKLRKVTAIKALGEIAEQRAVEPLVTALEDSDSDVREAASEALIKIGDPKTAELLKGALGHYHSDVREQAARVLEKIGVPDNLEVAALQAVAARDWDKAASLGEHAVKPLLVPLKTSYNSSLSHDAAEALSKIGSAAVGPLIAVLEDDNTTVRSNAAFALGNIGDPSAVEPLVKALKKIDGSNGRARGNAAEALGKIGDPRALEPLIESLGDWIHVVRKDAAEALVSLYRKGNIGEDKKKLILRSRSIITKEHSDRWNQEDGMVGHQDNGGVGIPFDI